MKRTSFASLFMLMFVLLMSSVASAAPTLVSPSPNSFGEIERITLNDPADVYSGGTIVVGGVQMILPKNLLIDLPANRLSLQQIFDQAPAACKTLGESGLAKADRCNGTGSGGIATLSAVRTNAGNVIVGDLFIQKAAESVHGVVTYINYDQGYYRVNGILNDPDTGAMVRLNDPNSRHTVQNGAGCSAGSLNCSPDPRFNLDPDNYTNTFATGYPLCIPSTVSRTFSNVLGNGGLALAQANADGTGDFLCPDTNRTAALVEPAVADSRRFAPIKVGDSVVAEGNYESVGGVRFLSAHSSTVQKALSTRNALGQPDYLFLEEVGYEAPPYQNQRLIALLIGFTTLANPATDVDVWSLHRDPVNNTIHEFPFATVKGCDAASGGVGNCSNQGLVGAGLNIFKIRYDIDFLVGPDPKLSPCAHLANPASRFFTSHPGICSGVGNATTKDIAVMSPVPHEIIARTGRKIDSATNAAIGNLITIDINGNPATNGEYLFPLGLNLGGLGVAEMSEVNINELNTPIPFEGIPWNLDRRLGPSGCLNAGGCEGGAAGNAAFALDPFPFSGLDPRLQATGFPANATYSDPIFSPTPLTNSRDRMFAYVQANGVFVGGTNTLPYALGTFPADPPFITILPTPILNMFPPIVVDDTATTTTGVSVPIDVLINDVAVFGTIDPTSVLIATGPASGTVLVNPTTGAITFSPVDPLVTSASFTYTVANNFGSRSLPGTVTVTINSPAPVANNDAATTTTDTPVVINVIANDTIAVSTINPASLSITAPTGAVAPNTNSGTAAANFDGTVTYTAPATPGTYVFSYTVKSSAVTQTISNVATVTVTVTQGTIPPVANNDTVTIPASSTVNINVIGNDTTIAPATINPASIIVSAATGGSSVANLDGTVTYTAPAVQGTYTFTYTVKDNSVSPFTSNVATVTVKVGDLNVASQANGGVASASSTLAGWNVAGANNGDRLPTGGPAGVWADNTPGVFPDLFQVTFNGLKTINEIDVFSLRDDTGDVVTAPTPTETFTLFGLTAFDVQYWNGSVWVTVPGGSITGNNLVWRKISFPAVTTDRIRIQVNTTVDGASRIVEVEAYNTSTNVALKGLGGVASASSTLAGWNVAAVNNGDRLHTNGVASVWADDTVTTFPDWLQVTFNGRKTINEIDVFSLRDNTGDVVTAPTPTETFTLFGLTAFDVQYWNGTAWVTVPGGSITGNNLVWRKISFPAVTTDRIRILVNATADGLSRIVEVEAYTATNVALQVNGGSASASSTLSGWNVAGVNNGDQLHTNGVASVWADNTPSVFPDWSQITFQGQKTINEIDVFSVRDNTGDFVNPPTLAETFTLYGLTAFDVQYWDGASWVTVPGGSITGNNQIWRQISFPAVTTDRIRILVNATVDGLSRIVEIEAYAQ